MESREDKKKTHLKQEGRVAQNHSAEFSCFLYRYILEIDKIKFSEAIFVEGHLMNIPAKFFLSLTIVYEPLVHL